MGINKQALQGSKTKVVPDYYDHATSILLLESSFRRYSTTHFVSLAIFFATTTVVIHTSELPQIIKLCILMPLGGGALLPISFCACMWPLSTGTFLSASPGGMSFPCAASLHFSGACTRRINLQPNPILSWSRAFSVTATASTA